MKQIEWTPIEQEQIGNDYESWLWWVGSRDDERIGTSTIIWISGIGCLYRQTVSTYFSEQEKPGTLGWETGALVGGPYD